MVLFEECLSSDNAVFRHQVPILPVNMSLSPLVRGAPGGRITALLRFADIPLDSVMDTRIYACRPVAVPFAKFQPAKRNFNPQNYGLLQAARATREN